MGRLGFERCLFEVMGGWSVVLFFDSWLLWSSLLFVVDELIVAICEHYKVCRCVEEVHR